VNSKKILIVEDDPIISHDLSLILQSNGFVVQCQAFTGVQAIDALAKHPLDFVLLDIHLGKGQSGIDVAKVIHEKYDVPYVFLTSFSDKSTLEAAMEQGPYGYLVKPFQEATLLSTIELALYNHSLSSKKVDILEKLKHLTDQELKICTALLEGKSYQAAADSLFISINTVRYHIKNLYTKYNVNGRAELMAEIMK